MPQDAFTLKYISKELEPMFVGGKISKINQPEKDELSLLIYTKFGTLKLEICTNAKNNRISLSDDEKPNPKVAPNFCMLLRKHLQNAEITAIKQVGFERIIYFDFKCFSEFEISEMRMYCEIMGKYSNIILTQNGVITGAMKTTSLEADAKRILFTGAKYTLPSPQGKCDPTNLKELEELFSRSSFSGDAAKFISGRIEGIAYSTALDMVEKYGEDITAADVFDYVNCSELSPCVTYLNGEPNDFKAVSQSRERQNFSSLLEAQKSYYSHVYKKNTFESKKRVLSSSISAQQKKLEKRLGGIMEKLTECEKADDIKLMGELITANIYAIKRGDASFEAVNYYDENCGKITIPLDRQLTPSQNAQKYYKKYAKLKRTLTNLTVQYDEISGKLDYISSINCNICAAETIYDLIETEDELTSLDLIKKVEEKKKKAKEVMPFRRYLIDGFTVLAGRNNVQNDRLLKSISADDIWLHTQKFHSSHVAIVTEGRQVPDEVILKAAEICAYYSDAKESGKVPVDFTCKKYVKKPPKANLGFVIYTDYKTIIVAPNAHNNLKEENGLY